MKRFWVALVIPTIVIVGLMSSSVRAQSSSRSSRSTSSQAKEDVSPSKSRETAVERRLGRLEKRLDQLIEEHSAILARFDEVMEELRIVKIRATLR